MDASAIVAATLTSSRRALDNLLDDQAAHQAIVSAAQLMISALENGGQIISCGNGGSMCDAMHFAEELSGRYRRDRRALPAVAISDPAYLTCVANDYGYEQSFSRFVSAFARAGDCVLCISTSGRSVNVLAAADAARAAGASVVALTGQGASPLGTKADVEISTVAGRYADRVQELHIKVIHVLIELVERRLFPNLYDEVSNSSPDS